MRLLSIITLTFVCLLANTTSFAAEKSVIAVIVAHDHPSKSISLPELKLIYWRKKTYWADGQPVHPINLPSDTALRLEFSNRVLSSAPNEQHDYWNGMYFHGISPPHVLLSNEAALLYVTTTKGAIAYIDACKVDENVKVMLWITKDQISANPPDKLNCGNNAE